ncbi:MAG: LPS assembly lipoprotein LptE [Robiginitomaculum sp.]
MITRFTLILFAALSLGACGFTPLHSPATSGISAPLPNMAIEFTDTKANGATGDKAEFLIHQALMARMGTGAKSPYSLTLSPTVSRGSIGIRSDDVASRYDLNLVINYVLTETGSDKVIAKDSVRAVSTFNAPNDPYGRIAAQDNAQKRATMEAADRLVLKIAADLRRAQ